MTIKKVVGWLAIAFLAFWLFTNPAGSADAVRGVVAGIGHGFQSVGTFFGQLFR